MLDQVTVPRRSLDLEDYVSIIRRNYRWILAPILIGLVISTVTAYVMQDTYVSSAMIRIVPQQISPEMVANITAEDVADRINGMAQTIESRTALASMISGFGLYKKELKSEPLEDVISEMKGNIRIRPVEGFTNSVTGKGTPAMSVAFSYRDPYTAQKVCADIVSRFMNASSETSSEMQKQANEFLNEEFDQAKKDLDVVEQKLADFRTKNAGRLPEEVNTNLAQMSALEQRGSGVSESLARISEQKMMLDSELQLAKDRLSAAQNNSPQSQAQNQKLSELDREVDQLNASIDSMKNRYTEDYPDLQTARDRLALLKRQREEAMKEKPKSDDTSAQASAAVTRERMEAQNVVNQIQLQLRANAMESQRIQKEGQQLNSALGGYQSRLEAAPSGEKEYAELVRDRDLAKQRYAEFDIKKQKSAESMELERRKQGETLEQLDAASLPTAPSAPKRLLIIPAGALIGLVLGVVLVGVREVKDASLKSIKDARAYSNLSVLGSIPLIENLALVQKRNRILWVSWAAGTALGLAIMAGSVVRYYMSKA